MSNRTELLEAALDGLPEGIALLDREENVIFWNRAADAISGRSAAELLGRALPESLHPLLVSVKHHDMLAVGARARQGELVHLRHRLGHDLPALARILVLRDGLGSRIGAALVFHPTESLDALPHGETAGEVGVQASQALLEDRLTSVFEDFSRGGEPFGLVWITVDQARALRRSHGVQACAAMFEELEQSLACGLRPGEQIGRWGDDDFLVLSHERTPEMLETHAQALAGLARTSDFRWWGDRVSLTASVGAAQAAAGETLAHLLERAQTAMLDSLHAGGNHVTAAPGGLSCLPS